jgi:hypothetical protein
MRSSFRPYHPLKFSNLLSYFILLFNIHVWYEIIATNVDYAVNFAELLENEKSYEFFVDNLFLLRVHCSVVYVSLTLMSNEVFSARQEIPVVKIADIKLMTFHADLHYKLLRFFYL